MLGLKWGKGKAEGASAGPAAQPEDFRTRFTQDLARMDQLPSLPAVVARLLDLINDPKASMDDLVRALREDPPLTARVLRLANSPVYGGGARILSVADAMMRMGLIEVQNLIMSVGLLRSLQGARRGLDYRSYWSHWFTVGTATEALARVAPGGGEQDAGAFTVGLLHDIGRFVVTGFYPEAAAGVLREQAQRRIPAVAAEVRVLGMDHAEVGGLLAERWGLPRPIVAGLAHHHHPEQAEPDLRRLPLLVNLAERICAGAGLGDPDEDEGAGDLAAACAAVGVDEAQTQAVAAAATASAGKSAALLKGA
jgi:HD-like signal output (HDOD) protein